MIKIFCPKQIVKQIDNYISSMFNLANPTQDIIDLFDKPKNYSIIGVDENTPPVEIELGKQLHLPEFYNWDHSVPCVGYGISLIKNKLKKEFIGLGSKEIKELKFSNIEITEKIIEPEFFFSGDTTHEIFNLSKGNQILKYPNIIIECSFLFEDVIENANVKKHMN